MSSRFLLPVLILVCCLFFHYPSALAVPLESPTQAIPRLRPWLHYPGLRERGEGRIHPLNKRTATPTDDAHVPGYSIPPSSGEADMPPWTQNLLSSQAPTPSDSMGPPPPPPGPSSMKHLPFWPIDPHEAGLYIDRPGSPPPTEEQALPNFNTSKRLREQTQEDTVRRTRKTPLRKSRLGRPNPNLNPNHEKRAVHEKRSPMNSPPASPPNSPPKTWIDKHAAEFDYSPPRRNSRSDPSSPSRGNVGLSAPNVRPPLPPSLPSPQTVESLPFGDPNPHPQRPIRIPQRRKAATHVGNPESPPALVGSAPAWTHKFSLMDFEEYNPGHGWDSRPARHSSGAGPSSGAGARPSRSRLSSAARPAADDGAGPSNAAAGLGWESDSSTRGGIPRQKSSHNLANLLASSNAGAGADRSSPVRGSPSPPRPARPSLPKHKSSLKLNTIPASFSEGALGAGPALPNVRSTSNLHGLGLGGGGLMRHSTGNMRQARVMGRRPRVTHGRPAEEGGGGVGSGEKVGRVSEEVGEGVRERHAEEGALDLLMARLAVAAKGGPGGRVHGGLGLGRAGAGVVGGGDAARGEAVRGGQLAGVGERGRGRGVAVGGPGAAGAVGGGSGDEAEWGNVIGVAEKVSPKRPREEKSADGDMVMRGRRRVGSSRASDEAGPSASNRGSPPGSPPRTLEWDQ